MANSSAALDNSSLDLSLCQLLDPAVLADPYPLFDRLRETDPVHWDVFLHAWVATRYDDVLQILRTFSADRTPGPERLEAMGLAEMSPIAALMVKQMLFMDAPAHSRIRSLAAFAFTPARVAVLRQRIEEITDRLLAPLRVRGSMELIEELAAPLPAIVTAHMLGVPEQDHGLLKDWSATFAEMLGNFQHNPDRVSHVVKVVNDMTAYFQRQIAEQQKNPRPGLIHSLLTAEVDGDRLTEEEVTANSIITMIGGQETTTNLIGNGLLELLNHPAEMERVRVDRSLLPSAVEELLRYQSPSQHTARIAPKDTVLGGNEIRQGQAVIAVMAAGNRDPLQFPEPNRLDLTRTPNRHLAFGWGSHFCFGAPLARLEGQIVLDRLLDLPNLHHTGESLAWRNNLGLRGLVAFPIAFDAVGQSV
jgi:cytochrome P450